MEAEADPWADARAAWPQVSVARDRFLAYLAERAPGGAASAADLYLACACALGDRAALAAFEAGPMAAAAAAARRTRADAHQVEEAAQILRTKLLVGDPPGIAAYAGTGPLRTWLQVALQRELWKVLGRARRDVQPATGELAELPAVDDDPELAHLKRTYAAEFKEAFEATLAALARRERTLLRYHYVDGLTIDEVGTLQRVHRATAARRIADVRQALLDGTRDRMIEKLRLAGEVELRSILRLIESQLQASVARLLR